jgi:hypothetical protein
MRSSLKIQPAHLQLHRYRTEWNRIPGIELSENFMLTLTQWQTLHSSSTQDPDLKKDMKFVTLHANTSGLQKIVS